MKTKYIKIWTIICALCVTSYATAQDDDEDSSEDIEQLIGVFEGYNEELNNYLFIVNFDDDGTTYIENYDFNIKDEKLLSKYDLTSEKLIGQKFLIKYTVKVVSETLEDGSEDFIEIYTIKDLKLIE